MFIISLGERVAGELGKRRSMDGFLNDGIRRSASGWRSKLADKTVDGLVGFFGFDVAHTRLAALEPAEVDVDRLASHLAELVSRGGGRAAIKGNPELKRAIRIYDFLKYGR